MASQGRKKQAHGHSTPFLSQQLESTHLNRVLPSGASQVKESCNTSCRSVKRSEFFVKRNGKVIGRHVFYPFIML